MPAGDLTSVSRLVVANDLSQFAGAALNTFNAVKSSVAITNPVPAVGGGGFETNDEIRENALAIFGSQNRAVTKEDYIVRSYNLPPHLGSVAKAYIVSDDQLNAGDASIDGVVERPAGIPNPFALNLYCLGFDNNRKLTSLNQATKENLKLYLAQYRMLTDAVNIKDAFIINIGVDFEIVVYKRYNKKDVLLKAIDQAKRFFSVDRWQINQPIILSELMLRLSEVDGVQSVQTVNINNKIDTTVGYSGNIYDITEATWDGVVYPSLDPSIFEVKYPNADIRGRAK